MSEANFPDGGLSIRVFRLERVEQELHAGLNVEFFKEGALGLGGRVNGGDHVGERAVRRGRGKVFFEVLKGLGVVGKKI